MLPTRRQPSGWILLLLLALCPGAGPALAEVNYAHDFPCGYCHIPHLAKGESLWPYEAPDIVGGWYDRTIARMCYYCHQAGSPYGGSDMVANAFGNGEYGVHMFDLGRLPPNLDGAPYPPPDFLVLRPDGNMDCNTCHDPHGGSRPNYRLDSVEESCRACHGRAGSAVGKENVTEAGRSTHPVDVAYDFTRTDTQEEPLPRAYLFRPEASSPVVTRDLAEPLPGVEAYWNLGAHMPQDRIMCPTCHAVHGGEDYQPDPVTGARQPFDRLLAVPTVGYSAASPGNGAVAALCQACHRGGDPGETVRAPPGGATDHPMGLPSGRLELDRHVDLAASDPSSLGVGGPGWTPYWGPGGELTCVTCHDVHGGLGATSLFRAADEVAGGGPQTADNFCDTCHWNSAPAAHHSNTRNYADAIVICEDCHGKAGTGGYVAHGSFFDAFVQPPEDVTRNLPSVLGSPETLTFLAADVEANKDSALCAYCHDPADPTVFALDVTPVGLVSFEDSVFPASHGERRGTASHQVFRGDNDSIGQVGTRYQAGGQPDAGILDVGAFSTGYYPKYGEASGGGDVAPVPGENDLLICESCHNVLFNVGTYFLENNVSTGYPPEEIGFMTNLLLELYEDDSSVGGVASESPDVDGVPTDSRLCIRCHPFSVEFGPSHLHGEPDGYMDWGQGLERDSPNLAGWSEATLGNVGLEIYPLRKDFPSRLSWRPGSSDWAKFDCDACHRPHNAADTSTMMDNRDGSPAPLITEFAGPIDDRPGSPTYGNPAMRAEMCESCHMPKAL